MKRRLSMVLLSLIVAFAAIAFSPATASAEGTTLEAGDIVFVGLNSDGDDEFSLLLLRDIAAGTSFYITDKGWDGSYFVDNIGDGIWQWTASSAMSAGDIIHIKTTNNGIIEAGSLAATPGTVIWVQNNATVISYGGDQVFLYQGPHADPTFIAGVHYNVETDTTTGNWDGVADAAAKSALPGQLTNGVNAIWVYQQDATPTERDSFRYNGSTTKGTPDELRAAIGNLDNWDVDSTNTTAYELNPLPYSFEVEGDTPPSVSITSAEGDATNSSPFTVTFTFNEDVTGFALGDITVSNGAASNFTANSASSYSADITPVADGTVTVDVAANVCTDTTGNSNTAAAQFSIDYDTAAPTVSITSTEGDPTNSSPFTVVFTFNEDVTGFALGDITVSNGAASNFTANSVSSFSADITPVGDGTVTVDVAANVCTDLAGNSNTAAAQFSIEYDTAAPTVSITSTEGDPTNSSPFTVTFTISEDVTGFAVGDITVSNGAASNFTTNSASSYAADITPSADGTVAVDVAAEVCTDIAGNSNTAAAQFSIVSDTTGPAGASIIINNSWDTYTNSTSVTLTLGATGASEMMISEDSAFGGASYEAYAASKAFTLSSSDGEKTVYVKYKDAAGNETSAVNDTIILDTTPPTVTITSTAASPTNAALIPFTVTFSEHVTSLAYSLFNGTVDHYTITGNIWEYYIAPIADGEVTFIVDGRSSSDDAGNRNIDAEDVQLSIVSDMTAPTGASVSINSGDVYTNSTSVTLALGATDASEMIISENSDFSGASYETYATSKSVTLSSGDGIKIVYVKYKDAAGNESWAVSDAIQLDTAAPTGTVISINDADVYTNSTSVTLTLDATGASEMMVSEDSAFVGASYEAYCTSKAFTLSSGDGEKTVYVKYRDAVGNVSDVVSDSIELDTTAPTVTITTTESDPTNAAVILVTITFSEDVTGFDVSDISVGNGSADNFSGSGTTYTADITPSADGTVTADIAADAAVDVADNGNTAATQLSIVSDTQAPTIIKNRGLTLSEGGRASLAALIAASDTGTDNDTIIYTITDRPDNGRLSKTVFTQAQMDAGSVVYTHDDSNTTSDIFTFKIADTNGNERTGITFRIIVAAIDDDSKPTATPTSAPTPTPTPTATPKLTDGGTEDVPDTGTETPDAEEITQEPVEENEGGSVTVTFNTDILPSGTTAIQLPDGTVASLTGDDTLTLTVSADVIDNGKVQLIPIDKEGTPLGTFEVQTDNGVLIDVSDMDPAGGGIWPVLLWVIIGLAAVGGIAVAVYLILKKRKVFK